MKMPTPPGEQSGSRKHSLLKTIEEKWNVLKRFQAQRLFNKKMACVFNRYQPHPTERRVRTGFNWTTTVKVVLARCSDHQALFPSD